MKNKIILLTGFSLAVVLCVALPRALLAYDEIVVKDGGTIRGTVKVGRQGSEAAPVHITKSRKSAKNVPNETLVVGAGQGLRYAVVTLEGIIKGIAMEKEVCLTR